LPQEQYDDGNAALAAHSTLLVLDRPFVHRLRQVTGKDTKLRNEIRLTAEEFERLSEASFADLKSKSL